MHKELIKDGTLIHNKSKQTKSIRIEIKRQLRTSMEI